MINKNFFLLLQKKIVLYLLIIYSVYCSLSIGTSWDESSHLLQGKSVFNYLFTFGSLDKYTHYREYYSASYWAFVYFVTQFFPKYYEISIFHLVNLAIGWMSLIGFYKLGKILFNKEIGILFFIFLFFQPIFFVHLSINPKDTILAFCHIWFFFFTFEYIKKQTINFASKKIIFKLGLLLAIGSGIQFYFVASLMPIILFLLFEIFFFKKLINKEFSNKKFTKDILYITLVCSIFFVIFWIDVHENIITKPLEIFVSSFETIRGWPANLLNGQVFFSTNVPKNYIFLSTIYKSPEYILVFYIIFFIFFIKIKHFFSKEIERFNYKLFLVFLIIIFPTLILFINPFPVYDGIRLFLWYIPYTLIVPCLAFYYLIKNLDLIINKIIFSFVFIFLLFNLIFFFGYTPYQYTYLNMLAGKFDTKNIKFENDYWGVTLKELFKKIKKSDIQPGKISVYLCGVPTDEIKKYIKQNKIKNMIFDSFEKSNYIVLTNRVVIFNSDAKKKLIKCTDLVDQKIVTIERMGHTLAIFGTIKK